MADLTSSQQKTGLRKYRGLIVLVALFLILTVSMLASNVVATARLAQFTSLVDIASRQGSIIQQMSKNLMDVNLYLAEAQQKSEQHEDENVAIQLSSLPQDALYRLKEIKELSEQFESTLNAFESGGKVQMSDGTEILIESVSGNVAADKSLAHTRQIWEPYRGLIDSFLQASTVDKINKHTSDYLVDYTRQYNRTMLLEAEKLGIALTDEVNQQADMWQYIQAGGILAAFVLFGLIVFGALRQLMHNDNLLARANREMQEIMSSVHEGLFLVDKDFVIGGQYSTRLEEIIGQKDLGGKKLADVLSPYIPESEVETTKVFIDQLYSEWVVEDLIEDLNPLSRINIQVRNTDGSIESKYVDFKFFRVVHNDKIERVLVSVIDTTEAVLLQANLEMQREQEAKEIEMLSTIINTNPTVLANFIKETRERLEDINATLKSSEGTGNQTELRAKISYMSRIVHSMKGESSALKLHRMVDMCENLEEMLFILKKQKILSGQDFFGMVIVLEDLFRIVDVLSNFGQRGNIVQQVNVPVAQDINDGEHPQIIHLKEFIGDIAKRSHKRAVLLTHDLDTSKLSENQIQVLKDICVQLLRNAVIHGIEAPAIRIQRHKTATGCLKLSLHEENDCWVFTAEDDGNGIDFDKIREKAVIKGLCTQAEAEQLTTQRLIEMMFGEGFSTADTATEDAGKGIGMGIIKDMVRKLGGKLTVATQPTKYTRFSITFPKGNE